MTLGRSTDRRIARHLPNCIQILCQHHGATAKTRCCQGGLDPGVTAANNQDVDPIRECEHFLEFRASGPEADEKGSRPCGPPSTVALTIIRSGKNPARNCRQAPQGTIGSIVSATTAIVTNSRCPAATALPIPIRSAQIVRPWEIFSMLLQSKTAADLH